MHQDTNIYLCVNLYQLQRIFNAYRNEVNRKSRKISSYHTHEENYYFKQAGIDDVLREKGFKVIIQEPLDYVKINGGLCNEFGLESGQSISEQSFLNILSGKNIEGDKVCRKHKVSGIDLTFSAPKSVSIEGLVTNRSPEISRAHDAAVIETMKDIEKHHSYARPPQELDGQPAKWFM